MRIFNRKQSVEASSTLAAQPTLSIGQVGYILVVSLLLITWFKHERLNDYWQQTYQNTGMWQHLNRVPFWQHGKTVAASLDSQPAFDALATTNRQINQSLNQQWYADTLARKREIAEYKQRQAEQIAQQANEPQTQQVHLAAPDQVIMTDDKWVFFAGDSLMQGVAPWVMRKLQQQYGVQSLNLSKQSTGLSYDQFLDWPATIDATLDEYPDIGVLVIFLGPNDPWAIPNPDKRGGKYIEFATPRWVTFYNDKIQHILQSAQHHHVQVIWVTPPAMKRPKLDQQMAQLSDIMRQSIGNQAVIIDGRALLAETGQQSYVDSVTINGKITKLRSADGIHFTLQGQQRVADAVLSRIHIQPTTNP